MCSALPARSYAPVAWLNRDASASERRSTLKICFDPEIIKPLDGHTSFFFLIIHKDILKKAHPTTLLPNGRKRTPEILSSKDMKVMSKQCSRLFRRCIPTAILLNKIILLTSNLPKIPLDNWNREFLFFSSQPLTCIKQNVAVRSCTWKELKISLFLKIQGQILLLLSH